MTMHLCTTCDEIHSNERLCGFVVIIASAMRTANALALVNQLAVRDARGRARGAATPC